MIASDDGQTTEAKGEEFTVGGFKSAIDYVRFRRAREPRKPIPFPVRVAEAVVGVFVVVFAVLFLFWPAAQTCLVVRDKSLAENGMSRFVPMWFGSLAPRFESWAGRYLASGGGTNAEVFDVAATEWPMFGSVFFLCTAADLHREGLIDASKPPFKGAIEKALAIVVSPDTATWVKAKWGEDYLYEENVFYRMLLIMGIAAYEEMMGESEHRPLMQAQWRDLAEKFERAPMSLLDDYPGECWPSDVVWAAAAVRRAAKLEGLDVTAGESLVRNLDGPFSMDGLPVSKVATSGKGGTKKIVDIVEGPRGCGHSAMFIFALDIDQQIASKWFTKYVEDFWQRNAWACGFRENPRDAEYEIEDVDSGPVLWGFGSVASAFGIGTARTYGRYDLARPLVLEALSAAWSTPFGFMTPRLMGRYAMGGDPLGEAALLFSMTRPCRIQPVTPADSYVPLSVWGTIVFQSALGLLFVFVGCRMALRLLRVSHRGTEEQRRTEKKRELPSL